MSLKRITLEDLKKSEPDIARIGSTISAALHKELMAFCDEESISVSEVVRAGITNFMLDTNAARAPKKPVR